MTTALIVAGVVILIGSIIQGVVGYGLNLLAGPILALLDPMLVPVPVLIVASVQATLAVVREHGHTHWPGVGWAMLGRLPGNVLGVLAVATLPVRGFNIVVALSVIACVVLSVVAWKPRPTPPGLVIAGTASGTFGTASAIGGPPIALLYQNSKGPTVRATLGAYFFLASVSSIVTLAVAGEVHGEHLHAALLLLPFMAAGFALSSPARRFIDAGRVRAAVLTVASVAAVILLVRSVL
ncbi:hypothetical protein EV193_102213 [Herbihabitans rhizosphaerae]|uniref:Probable membrane transporter protein n=1 Tax=Herbihabitans rhizosphaerae TaxID=1872711 RepID=A0A4Q7L274_9PSEU|nr:sulfite exporter TauE/SafE family protein [Herbihabitans rhizosphaerae]RZS43234.1 hypothetical protein EV193_102213 [Herbihabitans rhizosphaerae]